jgi:hypothetical protein
MKLLIDNRDLSGLREYTKWLDAEKGPKIVRRLNQGSEMETWLVAEAGQMIVPRVGARVFLVRDDGTLLFGGYLQDAPRQEFVGNGAQGTVSRYLLCARGEEARLDRKPLPPRLASAGGKAADLLLAITNDAAGVPVDASGVQDVGDVGPFALVPGEVWSKAAKEIADRARASWRVEDQAVQLVPIGSTVYTLSDADPNFAPDALRLQRHGDVVNEIAVEGGSEPEMYVKDYFVGDGHTLRFPMSMQPFLRVAETLVEEEYAGSELSPQRWEVADDNGTVSVSEGKLKMNGTPQATGRASVCLEEKLELGGGLVLEHGAVAVNGDGVLGGIYAHPLGGSGDGADPLSGCIAGFAVSSQGGTLRAVISGSATGPTIAMQVGHRYVLRTRVTSAEVYRVAQFYRSSADEHRAAGAEATAVRFVLEVQDINLSQPSTQVTEAMLLFDGVVANTPTTATYAVMNGARLNGEVSYTRLRRMMAAEVRVTAADGSSTQTQSVGMLSDGAQCSITVEPAVYFFSPYKPATDERVVVRYRSSRHANCRVNDAASIEAMRYPMDDGVRAASVRVASPMPRTTEDCEAAALALLDDSVKPAWEGEYSTWTDFLPQGATDLFPGDVVLVDVAEQGATISAVVREVSIEMADAANDRGKYTLKFANEAAEPIAVRVSGRRKREAENADGDQARLLDAPPQAVERGAIGAWLASLPDAEVTQITDTSVTVDTGFAPPGGGGFEVRSGGDWGWGRVTDRNLLGRFTTRTFTLPKNERGQDYYLRMYDGATPPNYSRRTTLLHVDVKP